MDKDLKVCYTSSTKLNTVKKKRQKPVLYTLEQVVLAVNHWSMTTVNTENVKQFINKEVKDEKQLSFLDH